MFTHRNLVVASSDIIKKNPHRKDANALYLIWCILFRRFFFSWVLCKVCACIVVIRNLFKISKSYKTWCGIFCADSNKVVVIVVLWISFMLLLYAQLAVNKRVQQLIAACSLFSFIEVLGNRTRFLSSYIYIFETFFYFWSEMMDFLRKDYNSILVLIYIICILRGLYHPFFPNRVLLLRAYIHTHTRAHITAATDGTTFVCSLCI